MRCVNTYSNLSNKLSIYKTNVYPQPDKSQALQRRDASLQNTVFHDGGLWPDTAVSYGSYDISSPYVSSDTHGEVL